MNEHDFMKELESLNDDSEPGFLKELSQQAPDVLHMRIMDSIRQEALKEKVQEVEPVIELKRRIKFDYRKYASFTAAAALLIFAFSSVPNQLLETKVTPDSIAHKDKVTITGTATPSKKINASTNSKANIQSSLSNIKDYKNNADNVSKIIANKKQSKVVSFGKATIEVKKVIKNSSEKPTLFAEKALPTITAKKNNPIHSAVVDKVILDKTATGNSTTKSHESTTKNQANDIPIADVTISSADKAFGSDTAKTQDIKVPDVNIKSSGDTNNTKTPNDTGATDNSSNNNPSDNSGNVASTEPNSTTDLSPYSNQAKDLLGAMADVTINYEISLDLSQTDIIQFVKEKGVAISDEIYKLNKADFATLAQMLDQNNIPIKLDNEITDQFVFIEINLK